MEKTFCSKLFILSIITMLASMCSIESHASTIVVGPTENVSVFWIDPNNLDHNTPASYQQWGQVFTAEGYYLESISFYLRSGSQENDATYFEIRIKEWSEILSEPIGTTLYESPHVLFSGIDTSGSPEWGTYPTIFPTSIQLTQGNKYIAEIAGDGVADMNTSSGYTEGGLYLYSDKSEWCSYCPIGWHEFGDYDLRSDMVFSSAKPVPEPSTILLFSIGILSFLGFRRKHRKN